MYRERLARLTDEQLHNVELFLSEAETITKKRRGGEPVEAFVAQLKAKARELANPEQGPKGNLIGQ